MTKKHQKRSFHQQAIIGIVFALAIIAVILSSVADRKGSTASVAIGDVHVDAETTALMTTLADDDPFLGSPDAPIVMVEFSDFQCPYCKRFEDQTFADLKKDFIDTGLVKFVYRDLPLSFHQYSFPAAQAAACAKEQGAYWEYHDMLFAHQDKLDRQSLVSYAGQVGINTEQFTACLDSGKYDEEIQADAAAAATQGIGGTPGFVINGVVVSGAQPIDRFIDVICAQAPGSGPCKDIPPPVDLKITILNDDRCPTCDVSQLKAVTTQLFPGATYTLVDAQSKEGEALIAEHNLVYAPAFLFGPELLETRSWKTNDQLHSAFVETDSGYRLRDEAIGATWFLSEEAQAAYTAKLNLALQRDPNDGVPQVDFFVMSYCPYGNQAEELLKPVFDKLKGVASFRPHYVIYNQGSGCYTDTDGTSLCSLHGKVELNQDIRELCVYRANGEQAWFDFALAMNNQCDQTNADTCWESVAQGQGLDTAAISSCFEENKLTYAREEYDLNALLGVRGSPTLFFEGELYAGGRTSNDYLAALCQSFDAQNKPEACSGVVAEPVQQQATSTAAGCGI